MAMAIASATTAQTAKVRVTAYYAAKGARTANGTKVTDPARQRLCAVSPDLLKKFPMGEYVVLEGIGKYRIADKTSKRIKNTIDILIPRSQKAVTRQNIKATLEYDND